MDEYDDILCDLLSPSFDIKNFRFLKTVFNTNRLNNNLPVSSKTPVFSTGKLKIRPLSFKTKKLVSTMARLDPVLFNHSTNLATHAFNFGSLLKLDNKYLNHLYNASLLHDIGKLFYKDLLDLPRKLTSQEREEIKDHVIASYILLTKNNYSFQIRLLALNHHLRTNGYPSKDVDELSFEISRVSKKIGISLSDNRLSEFTLLNEKDKLILSIIQILDIFEALIDINRPYKSGVPLQRVVEEYDGGWGDRFDEKLKKTFRVYIKMLSRKAIQSSSSLSSLQRPELSL